MIKWIAGAAALGFLLSAIWLAAPWAPGRILQSGVESKVERLEEENEQLRHVSERLKKENEQLRDRLEAGDGEKQAQVFQEMLN